MKNHNADEALKYVSKIFFALLLGIVPQQSEQSKVNLYHKSLAKIR